MGLQRTCLCVLLILGGSWIVSAANRPVRQACGSRKFQCKSGQCIDGTSVCDGSVECSDGSDETQTTCGNQICPRYLFRCSYGACVRGTAKCDGITDCADNSDELLPQCPNAGVQPNTCGKRKFKCNSGECIDESAKCDGTKNCKDGSDETITQCSSLRCPGYLFRCSYGACINKNLQCDGKVQCEGDSSDEDPTLCGTPLKKTCTLPLNQPNLNFKVWGCESADCQYGPGANVPQGSVFSYSCDAGYKIVGRENVVCLEKGWSDPPPKCERVKCPPISDDSLHVECLDKNKQKVMCNKPAEVGTTAVLNCRNNFIKRNEFTFPPINCTETGKWSQEPFSCIPECGRLIPKGETYIKNGKVVEVGEFPWHVGLYYTSSREQICGGSLISRTLVITAAHCLEKANSPQNYTVIAGKFHRDWNTVDEEEQRLSVKSIEVKENYAGIENNYANDIGILVLMVEVNITAFVSPVCLDVHSEYTNYHLEEGSFGSVAGWGINENNTASEKLQTAKLPYVGYRECKNSVAVSFRPNFVNDKFCAGYLNGTSVCKGDSGGGLAFEEEIGHKKVWYLQGVVSVGQPSTDGKQSCSSQRVLFTKVVDHMPWVSSILNKYDS